MKHKKFIYTNKRQSQRAIMAVILGIISNVSLVMVVYLSYLKNGEIEIGYGLTGFLSAMFSLIGLVLGLITAEDRIYFKLLPVLGILLNLVALGFVGFLLQMGL